MSILTDVLRHDVFPALGCTEPIAIAYAASLAGSELEGELTQVEIQVDPGVYKNGFAVSIPNTKGERGNLIAGVLGALVCQPEQEMEILSGVTDALLSQAKAIIQAGNASIACDRSQRQLYIDVTLHAGEESSRAVIQGSHTNLVRLTHNGKDLLHIEADHGNCHQEDEVRAQLRQLTIYDLVDLVEELGESDCDYIREGIEMNLRISKAGHKLERVSRYVAELIGTQREADVFSSCEVVTTSAADARMAGLNLPVMSSGGSGNQGIVAILVPHLVGEHNGVDEGTIIRSIALSHLVNSYIKCFTGDLSPLCGCAIAAGVGAAVAIVYQKVGKDMGKITLAVNNLISDLGGMLCDGAKAGCALKVATSTNSAIRSAQMALNDHGITEVEGFVGATPEESIQNLSRIGHVGMERADDTMLDIMIGKATARTPETPS